MNTNFAFEVVSTENASHILLNEILEAMNSKQMVGGIFCDLHKAFDCINHGVLLEKLKFYGVSGKFYNLVKLYLNGRCQKVILSHNNSVESTWEKVKQGGTTGINSGTHFLSSIQSVTGEKGQTSGGCSLC